ncbi:MAG: hypothetical protein PXX73_04735 [Sideroxydans sp.]|nr:hypothetical protein [Sideroxydans sp.]
MKLSCPACGALASLDALLGHEGARSAVLAAMALPAPVGKVMVQYLGLFRPAQRQLSFDRVHTLINELLPMIAAAKIERGGRIWSAPQEYWVNAIQEMLARREAQGLTLPLKNHAYLLTIIAGYSSKAEAKQEESSETQRSGNTVTSTGAAYQRNPLLDAAKKVATPMPEHLRRKKKAPNDTT